MGTLGNGKLQGWKSSPSSEGAAGVGCATHAYLFYIDFQVYLSYRSSCARENSARWRASGLHHLNGTWVPFGSLTSRRTLFDSFERSKIFQVA